MYGINDCNELKMTNFLPVMAQINLKSFQRLSKYIRADSHRVLIGV